MTGLNGKENGHPLRGSESRLINDAAVIDNLCPHSLTDEQAMLGLQEFSPLQKPLMTPPRLLLKDKLPKPNSDHAGQTSQLLLAIFITYWLKTVALLRVSLLYEYERGTAFLLITLAAGGGAVHYFVLNAEPDWFELALPAILFAWLLWLLRDTCLRRVCLMFVLAFLTGMATAKWETQRHATPMLGSSVSTILTARIISLEQEAERNGKAGQWRVVADVLATERPQLRYAPERLRLTARDLPALAEAGSIIKGAVRLRAHGGPLRSGQYDFAFHGFFRDIGGNGFYLGVPKLATDYAELKPPYQSLNARIEYTIGALRAVIGGRIMQALSGENGAVAAALISGQRAGISEKTNEALRLAGLAHILSISGLHLALAAGIVMFAARSFAGLFPALPLYYPVKKIAAVISLFSSGFYLALSGADVAAQRSFIMLAVMLLACLFDRQALTLRNLAIAAIFTLIIAPHEILGPSFQMSYSATGALIAGFAWWKLRKRRGGDVSLRQTGLLHKIQHSLLATLATSLVAGTASGLYAAFHFNNMAPLGMLGNAMALPVISVAIMPFGVMALLFMPFGLEWLPLQVMGLGIELVKYIADFVAGLSPDIVPGLLPAPVMLLWTAAMMTAMLLTSYLRWLSVGFLLAGCIALLGFSLPDIIISEDTRLVAIRQNNILYTNRSRPAAFTIDNWRKAYRITDIRVPDPKGAIGHTGFICEQGLCSFDFDDGRILAYAENVDAGEAACLIADVVILAYAGDLSCAKHAAMSDKSHTKQLVINRQQLALKGVAEIYLEPAGQGIMTANAVYALGAPQRPWHLYRLYSRAARNLAERK